MKIFSVVVLAQDPDGDILSISRRNSPDDIGLPGGKIEEGETPEQAAIRESLEEVGIEIRLEDLEAVYDRLDSPTETEKVCRCFRVRTWAGRPRAMENGFKVRWVPISRILEPTNTFAHYNRGLFQHLGMI